MLTSNDKTPLIVFITCGTEDEATHISNTLVQKNLIACGNIIPEITSIFRWEGRLNSDEEVLLIAKSRQGVLDELMDEVRELHSYQTPEIIAMPIVGGSKAYLDWVIDETTPGD